eukprot:TRINITY_DN43992_c0_g1_i1.p1 TRINITY_DN43992_c0_g1~~TRINITY_DN43992_c0_g1_i1.p1  ORF type:complete len:368 (-),score=41.87 TRINITY_DN43992_c0_g1_i1:74-1177(-)
MSSRRRREETRSSQYLEEVEEDRFQNGCLVKPTHVSPAARRRIRCILGTSSWRLERRHGYVRPPLCLPCGNDCVLADLGECGDRKCGNYRLGKYCDVRPSFLEFCVSHIFRQLSTSRLRQGIVFCSLGSGQLLFDWELLERLTRQEGVEVSTAHLIDKDYGGSARRESAVRAQQTMAGWFTDQAPRTIRSFLYADDFERWVKVNGEAVDVLLDCDAVSARRKIDTTAFREAVLRSGGICLVLSNPAKRTALVRRETGLEMLEQHVYRRGSWRRREDVSASRSRSKRKRSRGRSRRRRRSVGRGPSEPAAGGVGRSAAVEDDDCYCVSCCRHTGSDGCDAGGDRRRRRLRDEKGDGRASEGRSRARRR